MLMGRGPLRVPTNARRMRIWRGLGGRRRGWRGIAPLTLVPALALVALALALTSGPPPADTRCLGSALCFEGTVTDIVDGDTLDVDGRRVRLALVDTPELGEAGHEAATQFTANLCPVGSRALVDEDDGQTGGSYGRIVAVVHCGGRNLNAELLYAGHAVILEQFCGVSEFATQSWATGCG